MIKTMIEMMMMMCSFCRRKEEEPEERPSMGGRGHPLFGNLNPFDILQHLLKQSRSPREVFFPKLKISGSDKKAKKVPDSLRAYAESVSQLKAAQKREQQGKRRLSVDQSERYESNHLAGRGRNPNQDYDFHNSVRRSGSGLNGNNTMPDSVEKLNEIQENSLGNLENTESSHTEEEKDYDYDYEADEVSDNDEGGEDSEESDEGPEYYYYYYYEYPDEGIDISHEMDAGTKEPIYEPLPTPLWQKGKHINSTAAESAAEKSESISESRHSVKRVTLQN